MSSSLVHLATPVVSGDYKLRFKVPKQTLAVQLLCQKYKLRPTGVSTLSATKLCIRNRCCGEK